MSPVRSHERYWKLVLTLAIPALLALVGGAWLATQVSRVKNAQNETTRLRDVGFQARLLGDEFQDALAALRLRSIAIWRGRQNAPAGVPAPFTVAFLEDPVLLWAELELSADGKQVARIRQSLTNPTWSARDKVSAPISADDQDLRTAIFSMNLTGLRKQGVVLQEIRPDAQTRKEWVAFAFLAPANRTAVLALVDPTEAFPAFARWNFRDGTGGMSRAYWLDADGLVLAHSQKAYQGADFSRLPVYRDGALPMLQGGGQAAPAKYRAIDRLNTYTALTRVGELPLVLGVEELLEPEQEGMPSGIQEVRSGWFGVLCLVLGAAMLVAARIQGRFERLRAELGRSANAGEAEAEVEAEVSAIVPSDEVHDSWQVPPREQNRTQAQTQAPAQAQTQSQTQSQGKVRVLPVEAIARFAQFSELKKEARAEKEGSEAVIRFDSRELDRLAAEFDRDDLPEQVTPARLETEPQIILPGTPASGPALEAQAEHEEEIELDPEAAASMAVAQQLTDLAREICDGRPAMFFAHYPRSRTAILQAAAGAPTAAADDLYFPVAESLNRAVLRQEPRGLLSLRDYPPLKHLFAREFGIDDFQAWAVTGAASGTCRLLGILVTFVPGNLEPTQYESMVKLVRSTEPVYESTFFAEHGAE